MPLGSFRLKGGVWSHQHRVLVHLFYNITHFLEVNGCVRISSFPTVTSRDQWPRCPAMDCCSVAAGRLVIRNATRRWVAVRAAGSGAFRLVLAARELAHQRGLSAVLTVDRTKASSRGSRENQRR